MSYTQLYSHLVYRGLVTTRYLPPPPINPPLIWFKPNSYYEFHKGVAGRDLEGCFSLKSRVQDLVRGNILSFKDVGSNVNNNPLPGQGE